MAVIRDRFARRGVPMVTTAKALTDEEVLRMQKAAREPLVSLGGVFLAFFLPPTIVAALSAGVGLTPLPLSFPLLLAAAALALVPPAASMARTLRRSERRDEVPGEHAEDPGGPPA